MNFLHGIIKAEAKQARTKIEFIEHEIIFYTLEQCLCNKPTWLRQPNLINVKRTKAGLEESITAPSIREPKHCFVDRSALGEMNFFNICHLQNMVQYFAKYCVTS